MPCRVPSQARTSRRTSVVVRAAAWRGGEAVAGGYAGHDGPGNLPGGIEVVPGEGMGAADDGEAPAR